MNTIKTTHEVNLSGFDISFFMILFVIVGILIIGFVLK